MEQGKERDPELVGWMGCWQDRSAIFNSSSPGPETAAPVGAVSQPVIGGEGRTEAWTWHPWLLLSAHGTGPGRVTTAVAMEFGRGCLELAGILFLRAPC